MKDNKLTILTQPAIAPADIDAVAAKAEYDEAAARKATDARSAEAREHALRRGRVLQAMARK
jgi:F0F1-type ATP synthase epsilon subunit